MEPDGLQARLDRLAFTERSADEVTALLIDTVAGWGAEQGWRVYRRAPSVVSLPPPMDRQKSVVDVAFARPDGPPIVVEIDHTDRRRTVEKLVAEAEAGRIALWVRWGTGRFSEPTPPVRMVSVRVDRPRAGVFSRSSAPERQAPPHSTAPAVGGTPMSLPIDPA